MHDQDWERLPRLDCNQHFNSILESSANRFAALSSATDDDEHPPEPFTPVHQRNNKRGRERSPRQQAQAANSSQPIQHSSGTRTPASGTGGHLLRRRRSAVAVVVY